MRYLKCSPQRGVNGLSRYQLYSDHKKEMVSFEGEMIAEAETPIYMFPKTRRWSKRVVRLYRTNGNTYVYQSVDHWCCPSAELPHRSVMKFTDIKKMLCVLLHDYGDKAILETDTKLLLSAIRGDRLFAAQLKELWKD